ncbi:hypothetical protein LTR66_004627 [Elasticomyces elasticus]|nr:hypothetical protein LTR66_004627 [Elasticomyces elasticus]
MRFITAETKPSNDDGNATLRVACVGLPRCATSSLQSALQDHLGLGPTMHMASIMPSAASLKLAVRATNETNKAARQAMLHELFSGYNSTCDVPGCLFADDIIEMYPDVKLVLNQRNSVEAWERSMNDTIRRFHSSTFRVAGYLIPTQSLVSQYGRAWMDISTRRFGPSASPLGPEMYHKHNAWVRKLADDNGVQLLEWTPDMGWDPLCRFLDQPVPETEFPRLNDTAFMKMLITFMIIRGFLVWAAAILVPLLLVYAILRM